MAPDKIKKGLELIGCNDIVEFLKAADEGLDYDCNEAVAKDALAYIQQLESDIAEERELNEFLGDKVKQLESRLAQAERERDAAIVDMRSMAVEDICNLCARIDEGYIPMPPHCKYANDGDCFRWRGICSENTKEEEK